MVDLSMPELDGWEVFKALKANSLTAHIPCVAVTAHTDRDRARALAIGVQRFCGETLSDRGIAADSGAAACNQQITQITYLVPMMDLTSRGKPRRPSSRI